jgi:hypothetical protein
LDEYDLSTTASNFSLPRLLLIYNRALYQLESEEGFRRKEVCRGARDLILHVIGQVVNWSVLLATTSATARTALECSKVALNHAPPKRPYHDEPTQGPVFALLIQTKARENYSVAELSYPP